MHPLPTAEQVNTHTHTHTLTHSHTHTLTHSHTHILTHSLTHTHPVTALHSPSQGGWAHAAELLQGSGGLCAGGQCLLSQYLGQLLWPLHAVPDPALSAAGTVLGLQEASVPAGVSVSARVCVKCCYSSPPSPRFGDVRVTVGRHVVSLWHQLREKKGSFIPNLVKPFLEISLIKHKGL